MGYTSHQLTSRACRVVLAATLVLVAPLTNAEVLTFRAENKWVAPEDNKPLLALLKQAKSGKTVYSVKLPKENRPLAVTRLEVVTNLLAREAKAPVVMEETGTTTKPNTLEIK